MSQFSEWKTKLSSRIRDGRSAILVGLAQPELLKWTEHISQSAATIYDKALDATFLRTHIGGGDHRLFDGGHDLISAWQCIQAVSDTDTRSQEVVEYFTALWKDFTTTNGLPFATIDKASFDAWVDALTNKLPGLDRQYLVDAYSFDVMELVGSALGIVGAVFSLTRKDMERFSELLGSMGITAIASANPLMAIAVIALAGYAYYRKGVAPDLTEATRGAALATVSATIFAVLGMPVLIELVIVMIVSTHLRKQLASKADLVAMFEGNMRYTIERSRPAFQQLQLAVAQLRVLFNDAVLKIPDKPQ